MSTRTSWMVVAGIVAVSFLMSAVYYPQAPERVVSHWNAAGVPDGYMSKFWGLFLLPFIAAGLALLFLVIPKIDPLKANIAQFRRYYDRFVVVFLAYLLVIHGVVILWNYGVELSFNVVMPVGVGLLFIYIGSLMGHLKRNWFIGIRTPWTLSSDAVWEQTHRLGARLFQTSGLIAMTGAFFGSLAFFFILVPVLVAAIVAVVYSYVAYRRIEHASAK